MSNMEAQQIVQAGLERRKAERETAAQEARLERYEKEQIRFCNEHCADAKILRRQEESGRITREQFEARRAAKAEELAKELEREEAATDAVKKYAVSCMATLCLTIFTHLPVWAAITLCVSLAVFPVAYIFRLYFPAE